MYSIKKPLCAILIAMAPCLLFAQKKTETKKDDKVLSSETFSALKFRSIGPAVTSGRISDFAVNPNNNSEYYVASSSGGVWKTTNHGVTFSPVFDDQGSYSIGCISLDPQTQALYG